jgi:hypothetical protein
MSVDACKNRQGCCWCEGSRLIKCARCGHFCCSKHAGSLHHDCLEQKDLVLEKHPEEMAPMGLTQEREEDFMDDRIAFCTGVLTKLTTLRDRYRMGRIRWEDLRGEIQAIMEGQ